MLQFLVPSSLVILSTIASVVIPPIHADLATARASILLVALLLLAESGSGIWRGSYTETWVDIFGLVQICLLTVALAETWLVYTLANKYDRPALALAIDLAVRTTFPLIYICITAGLLVLPFSREGFEWIMISAAVFTAAGFAEITRHAVKQGAVHRRELYTKLFRLIAPHIIFPPWQPFGGRGRGRRVAWQCA
jgi:hypothetical protein